MRVAIIGFGASGLLAAANQVRAAAGPLTLYILDETHDGLGVAYATNNPEHLLNVTAAKMSAFPDAPDDFVHWLGKADAARAKQALGVVADYGANDYVPRALYGAYLQSIWREAQAVAASKGLEIKLVPSRAVAVQQTPLAVLSARGDAIAVDAIVLAVGHEGKPLYTHCDSAALLQNPWAPDVLKDAAQWPSPVVLLGAGLTAVDMLLSLRRAGYKGQVVATSRHGLLPRAHAQQQSIFNFQAREMASLRSLRAMVRRVRHAIATHGDWRAVMDALRPYTPVLWQRLSTREQQRFLRLFMPYWNVHRHRMAPTIAARVEAEIAKGSLRVLASRNIALEAHAQGVMVNITSAAGIEMLAPSRIINCAGQELRLAHSRNPLLAQMLAQGMLEPHATGLGIAADMHGKAWGTLHPKVQVIGAWLTGQRLESTAIPELRQQAAARNRPSGE